MALRMIEIGLVLTLSGMLWSGVGAQSSCNQVIMGMPSCLSYITGNSSTPSSACCSQLANVAQSQPQCVCSILNGGATFGVTINQTLALTLPGSCSVQIPLVGQCNGELNSDFIPGLVLMFTKALNLKDLSDRGTVASGPIAAAIAPAPAKLSDKSPEVPTTSGIPSGVAGAGTKTVPSTDGKTSGGRIMDSPLPFVVLLFITSCVSAITGF